MTTNRPYPLRREEASGKAGAGFALLYRVFTPPNEGRGSFRSGSITTNNPGALSLPLRRPGLGVSSTAISGEEAYSPYDASSHSSQGNDFGGREVNFSASLVTGWENSRMLDHRAICWPGWARVPP